MPCNWHNVDYSFPKAGKTLLVKYNVFRSDSPYTYVVATYKDGWKMNYMDCGIITPVEIPKPDFWAYIEGDDEHE